MIVAMSDTDKPYPEQMELDEALHLNLVVRRLAHRYRQLAAHHLGTIGLQPGQEALLLVLGERKQCSQAELAAALDVEPPTVSSMVTKLEAAGTLSRTPSSADRRQAVVRLTPAGRRLLPKLRQANIALAEEATASLGADLGKTIAAIERLANAVPRATDPRAVRP